MDELGETTGDTDAGDPGYIGDEAELTGGFSIVLDEAKEGPDLGLDNLLGDGLAGAVLLGLGMAEELADRGFCCNVVVVFIAGVHTLGWGFGFFPSKCAPFAFSRRAA